MLFRTAGGEGMSLWKGVGSVPGGPVWSDVSLVFDNRILQAVNLASHISPISRVLLFGFLFVFAFAFDLL